MPADPETMNALREMATEITTKIDVKLDAHQAKQDETNRRIYDRIDAHAVESRAMQDRYATETRTAIGALSTQVSVVTSELHQHSAHDEEIHSRHEAAIKEAGDDRGKVWRAIAGLGASGGIGALIAKWLGHGGGGA